MRAAPKLLTVTIDEEWPKADKISWFGCLCGCGCIIIQMVGGDGETLAIGWLPPEDVREGLDFALSELAQPTAGPLQ